MEGCSQLRGEGEGEEMGDEEVDIIGFFFPALLSLEFCRCINNKRPLQK